MITHLPVLAIPCPPKPITSYGYSPKTRPALRLPQTDSILELFELAARQTPDPELMHHIRQVIAVKRRATGRSPLSSPPILDTHPDFDQEKI